MVRLFLLGAGDSCRCRECNEEAHRLLGPLNGVSAQRLKLSILVWDAITVWLDILISCKQPHKKFLNY